MQRNLSITIKSMLYRGGYRDFIKYLETDGRLDDIELYAYWLGRIGTAEGKIIDACKN